MKKDEVIKWFYNAGWYPERKIDINEYEKWILTFNVEMHDAGRRFLENFGKLSVPIFLNNLANKKETLKCTLIIDPYEAEEDDWILKSYGVHFNDKLIPIAAFNTASAELFMGEKGEVYECYSSYGYKVKGNDIFEVITNLNTVYNPHEVITMVDNEI